jgi:diguanylate cyclase (GGDEF)-like protein
VILFNERFVRLWRIPQSLLDSKNDQVLLDYVLSQLDEPEEFLVKVKALYGSDAETTDAVSFKDGRIFERFTSPMILDSSVIGRIWSFRDITERKQMEAQVRQLAFYDELTKLPNRRLLLDRLDQAMAACKRSSCHGAMMYVDLDKFKQLNDTHGHSAGDLLLKDVAARLKSCVRAIDTVARFGGDEFLVLISELSENKSEATEQAWEISRKISAALANPYMLKVHHEEKTETTVEHSCTGSIGVTLFDKDEVNREEILKRADMVMYQAKEAGRNLILFYGSKV